MMDIEQALSEAEQESRNTPNKTDKPIWTSYRYLQYNSCMDEAFRAPCLPRPKQAGLI